MTDTLRAYILRTVTAKAEDYQAGFTAEQIAAGQPLASAFRDAARGTDTGWWDGLIYTGDVYRLADAHRRDIAAALTAYAGDSVWLDLAAGNLDELWAALAACTLAPTFAAWEAAPSDPEAPGHDAAGDAHADALAFGLRFAVEYLLGEVAAEAGVEL